MSSPHVIRLRDPWELGPPNESRPDVVLSTRRFNCPTNLDTGADVDLVFQAVQTPVEVWLNDERLGSVSTGQAEVRFAVRPRLLSRNTVRLEFPSPPKVSPDDRGPLPRPDRWPLPSQWIEQVRLEIFDRTA